MSDKQTELAFNLSGADAVPLSAADLAALKRAPRPRLREFCRCFIAALMRPRCGFALFVSFVPFLLLVWL
jgi:hypothetical protein